MDPSRPTAGDAATLTRSIPDDISATYSLLPVAASTDITVPSKFTAKTVVPPPKTIGELMKYGASDASAAGAAASDASASAAPDISLVTDTFHSSSAHPGEHLYRYPSSPAYTSDPSGNNAGELEIWVPVSRHPRGSPVVMSSVSTRLSCPPTYTTPRASSTTGVECRT